MEKCKMKTNIRNQVAINLVINYSEIFYEGIDYSGVFFEDNKNCEILYSGEDFNDLIIVKYNYPGPLGIEEYKFYVDIYNKNIYTYTNQYGLCDCIEASIEANNVTSDDEMLVKWNKFLKELNEMYIFE